MKQSKSSPGTQKQKPITNKEGNIHEAPFQFQRLRLVKAGCTSYQYFGENVNIKLGETEPEPTGKHKPANKGSDEDAQQSFD